jgi:predicted Zn-dependent protease
MAGSSEHQPPGPAAGTGTVATGGPTGTQPPPTEQPSAGQPPLYQRLSNDAVTEARNGRPEQAHRLLAEAIRQRPDSPELHFNLAQVFIIQKRHAEAAEELKLYLQYLPDAPDRSDVERLLAEIHSADTR